MCGRYGMVEPKKIPTRFDVNTMPKDILPRYNAAPSQNLPVITRNSPNACHIFKWGMTPHWAKDSGKLLINAQSESAAEKRTFSKAFRERRCIIPATNFYEWKKVDGKKQPYLFKTKDQAMFGFAGLYFDEAGEKTFVILTTKPNSLVGDVHDRMPCILDKDDEDIWLNPDNVEPEQLMKVLKPYPANKMEAYPISPRINGFKFDDPSLINREPEQKALV